LQLDGALRGLKGNPVKIRNGPAAVSGDETRNPATGSLQSGPGRRGE
jgi:hypothetical protein